MLGSDFSGPAGGVCGPSPTLGWHRRWVIQVPPLHAPRSLCPSIARHPVVVWLPSNHSWKSQSGAREVPYAGMEGKILRTVWCSQNDAQTMASW